MDNNSSSNLTKEKLDINNKEKLKNFLIEKGIQPSYQRIKILEFLSGTKSHPTVDMIYNKISDELSTLSKTTIYNTLNTFLKKKVIMRLTIDENEVRYDFNTKPHPHFKCIQCGNVYDVELKNVNITEEDLEGYKIKEYQIYIKGICKECIEKNKDNQRKN